ncbi:MAG: hypothetical protein HY817_00930 [Candidatus Abawacabacteria bacterium]|nr:hypothetical protein [Candidatus Abawacabacteria bacterium]
MYDICIIGSGIAGKYIAWHLRHKSILWVSGQNPQYQSKGEYKVEQYLGPKDTWQAYASGLISFLSTKDLKSFPFHKDQYQLYQTELLRELKLVNFASFYSSARYKGFTNTLESIFPESQMHYFWGRQPENVDTAFQYREDFEKYKKDHQLLWPFSHDASEYLHAQYFVVSNDKISELVGTDKHGKKISIKAKHFIIACHVPGSIALLLRTYAFNRIRPHDALGRYFSDHAQTSLGILLPKTVVPRTTIPAFCYQDRQYQGIPFRLEFHVAPPIESLIERTRIRLKILSGQEFTDHFMRLVVVYNLPPLLGSCLKVRGRDYRQINPSPIFLSTFRRQRKVIMSYIRTQFLTDNRLVLLNRHFPFYFAGHLTGGVTFPEMVNENLQLHNWPNISIASTAVFPSNGLFNPTFTLLACAKHILASLRGSI